MGEYDAYMTGPAYEAAVAAWDNSRNSLKVAAVGQIAAEAALIENGYSPYGPDIVAQVAKEAGETSLARLTPALRALVLAATRLRPPHAEMEP